MEPRCPEPAGAAVIETKNDYGRQILVAYCDSCGEVFDHDCDTFHELVDALKDADWKFHKDTRAHTWRHHCPDCRERR